MFARSRARFVRSANSAARSAASRRSCVSKCPTTMWSIVFGRPFSCVFHRPGEYPPMIVPSTSAAAWSARGTASRSSSCQQSVPPTRASSFAAAAPAVRSASRSTSSRLPMPAATMRVPPSWTITASPRSPRSSPVAANSASRPSSPSSGGCVTGTARASALTCSGRAMSIVTPMAALEELLQLHRGAHVAFDLQLPGHVGARGVLLAGDDLLERLLRRRDGYVGVGTAFLHRHRAVVDVDRPLAGALDVEEVRVRHARRLRRIGARREVREEVLNCLSHGAGPYLLLQFHEEGSPCDAVAFGDVDGSHRRVVRGDERRLHLHRLEDDERLPRGDAVAGRDEHLDDRPRHRRADRGLLLRRPMVCCGGAIRRRGGWRRRQVEPPRRSPRVWG